MEIFKSVGLLKTYCSSCIPTHCFLANKYLLNLLCVLDHDLDIGKISSNNKMSPISSSFHSSVQDNEVALGYSQHTFLWYLPCSRNWSGHLMHTHSSNAENGPLQQALLFLFPSYILRNWDREVSHKLRTLVCGRAGIQIPSDSFSNTVFYCCFFKHVKNLGQVFRGIER